MASCEMCGKNSENLQKVKVAGSIMNLCSSCSNLGHSQESDKPKSFAFYHKKRDNSDNSILIENYTSKINSALAKKNLTVHHLARVLNIKESLLHKVLNNKFELELTLAKKIENFLDIKIITNSTDSKADFDESTIIVEEKEKESLNLADLIKDKLKKL